MTLAEHIYRMLLWLYPKKHRLAYARAMLQHSRDLSRDARERGGWHVTILFMRLLKDGIVNAGIEHIEAIMSANNRFKPTPWLIVLLAALPGLLFAFSLRHGPLLPILGYLYLGLLVIGLPIIWWRRQRFPVWALMPAGALIWSLTYMAGTGLAELVNSLGIFAPKMMGNMTAITMINFVLAAVIFVVLLRGQHMPSSVWLVIGIIVFGHVLLATLFSIARYGGDGLFAGMFEYFTTSGLGPAEGLMLVAVGLLAARQHGVLAILVVIGGYFYMFTDSDYLFGYPAREWTGLSTYLLTVTIFYMVVLPVALLRAKTRLGRAMAVFVPVVAFHVVRLTVPLLVIQQPLNMRPGDVIASINIVLSLILAWVLYSYIGDTARHSQPIENLEASPLPN
jgi:hypothetical protein